LGKQKGGRRAVWTKGEEGQDDLLDPFPNNSQIQNDQVERTEPGGENVIISNIGKRCNGLKKKINFTSSPPQKEGGPPPNIPIAHGSCLGKKERLEAFPGAYGKPARRRGTNPNLGPQKPSSNSCKKRHS